MRKDQTQMSGELTEPATALPTVSVIRARDFEVACPACGHVAEGWVCDPRGRTDKCDNCGTEYKIPGNVQIAF